MCKMYIFELWRAMRSGVVLTLTCFLLILIKFLSCFAYNFSVPNESESTQVPKTISTSKEIIRVVCSVIPEGNVPLIEPTIMYSDFWEAALRKFQANLSIETDTIIFYNKTYTSGCNEVYAKFVDCFRAYKSQLSNRTLYSYLLIFGPFCEVPFHERAVHLLKNYVRRLNDRQDVMITTTSSTLLSASNFDRSADSKINNIVAEGDVMFISGGVTDDGFILWKILVEYFKWKFIAILRFSQGTIFGMRFCKRLFEELKFLNAQDTSTEVIDQQWAVQDSNENDTYDDVMNNIWRGLANISRVFFVCSDGATLVRFLKQIESDQQSKQFKYGVISISVSNESFPNIISDLHEANAENALKYLKFIVPQATDCVEYDNIWSRKIRNKQVSGNVNDIDDTATTGVYFGRYYCSIFHYLRLMKQQLMSDVRNLTPETHLGRQFTDTYRPAQPRKKITKNSVHWLTELKIMTYDDTKKAFVNAVNVTWKNDSDDIVFRPISKIFWHDGDENLKDSLFICSNNEPSGFPCPKIVEQEMTPGQKYGLAFGTVGGLGLIVALSVFAVKLFMHTNKRFLMYRYALLTKQLVLPKPSTGRRPPNDENFGKYANEPVIIVTISTQLDKNALESKKLLQDIDHLVRFIGSKENFVPLLGFIYDKPTVYSLIFKLGMNANLRRVLQNIKLTTDLKFSLIRDLIVALKDIHQSQLKYHGDLRTNRCLIDERFVLRIMLTRLPNLRKLEQKLQLKTATVKSKACIRYARELWMAPELLRDRKLEPSSASDVYSFAIIMHEIVFQKGSFYIKELQGIKHFRDKKMIPECSKSSPSASSRAQRSESLHSGSQHSETSPEDESCAEFIVKQIVSGPFLRPSMPFVHKADKYKILEEIMESCWNESYQKRPKAVDILAELQTYMKNENIDVAFNTSKRLKSASRRMVHELLEKKAESIHERDRALKYLTHMMPTTLSYELLTGGTDVVPDEYKEVTIYFNDIVEFSSLMQQNVSIEIIEILHDVFQAYDHIVRFYDVVPLHRVGSSLLLASGVPHKNQLHASEIAQPALQIRHFAKNYKRVKLKLKAGIHSGPVMSGIVGRKIQQYGLFGDTVNTASRMSSHGNPGEIQISEATRNFLTQWPMFKITGPEEKMIKGKNIMKTYKLVSYGGHVLTVPLTRRLDDLPAPKSMSDPKLTLSADLSESHDRVSQTPKSLSPPRILKQSSTMTHKTSSIEDMISDASSKVKEEKRAKTSSTKRGKRTLSSKSGLKSQLLPFV